MLVRLENQKKSDLNRIALEIAEAFLAEPNSFSLSLNRQECIRYFQIIVRYYYKNKCLYAVSPDQRGWIAFYRRKQEPGRLARFCVMLQLLFAIPYFSLSKTGLSPENWIYYKDLYAGESDYIDIAMVAIKKPCQKQGLLRQLLEEPFALSQELQIPCILETDTRSNAQKYEHCGFRIVRDQPFPPELHLYAMEYRSGNIGSTL